MLAALVGVRVISLPAALLGFRPVDSDGYALDGWGLASNRIRYAISNHTVPGVSQPFTRLNGLRSLPISSLGNPALFHICQSGNGVTATDWPTYAAVAGALLLVGTVACYIPARRAMRLDPAVVLRAD